MAFLPGLGYAIAMLSVLIETRNNDEALARTLSSLVSAAVSGMVREVIVCDRAVSRETHAIADQTGCVYLTDGGIGAGVRQAKADWLLLLEPGARLVDGWTEAVEHYVGTMAMPARFTPSRADRRPWFVGMLRSSRALREGLLIRKAQALPLSRHAADAEAVARGLAGRRLAAEIRVADAG
ncbi:glycosyltransferase family 2 protein [Pseudaminobacter salicylatoxidans]|uniref:glycosyltransferase family 2 protein n=1 Tax=Pseudaminobacter salicylatoxidans TaxID=93369 RepID=UPI0003138B02|nr:glycosyltransferase [Pseudaminobacter salicylatoxidans]